MKKAKIIFSIILLVCLVAAFVGCTLEYGNPDSLGIGDMSVGKRITTGLLVSLLGIGMVFVVLIVLILFIKLLQVLMQLFKNMKKPQTKPQEVAPPVVAAPKDDSQADEEVVAAITAALVAYYEASGVVVTSDLPFKVRSIRQIK
ncbi:MAG: OadG family protein [Christensenellales bacterium]